MPATEVPAATPARGRREAAEPARAGAKDALDTQLDAVFSPMAAGSPTGSKPPTHPHTVVMDFDTSGSDLQPLAAQAAPTEIQLSSADVVEPDAPPKADGEDEVDDLFMELISD
jgi:hypothetical protein